MSSLQLFTNNAVTLLAAPISATATSLTVMSGHGAMFPQPTLPGEYFLVTLEDQSATFREIIRVTGRSGDTFTGLVRGQEGMTPRAWGASLGNDTLVDHRITAETMTRAMELPELSLNDLTNVNAPSPTVGQALLFDGTNWVSDNLPGVVFPPIPSSINDLSDVSTASPAPTVGQALVWNGTNWVPGTVGGGGSGTAWIHGENTGPVDIDPGWTLPINTVTYSDLNRGFKFLITTYMPINGMTKTMEVLATVGGNIVANTEDVDWVTYARIGYNFAGGVSVILNKPANQLIVRWQNSEANPVRVISTRIQHSAA